MSLILKRLSLGFILLALVSGGMLAWDWHRQLSEADGDGRGRQLDRRWRIYIIDYVQVQDTEEAEQGIIEGLRESGLVEGVDYTLNLGNAQGDMARLNALAARAVNERADLIITLSTPAFQTVSNRTRTIPILFTYLADPVMAGAGRSNTDHLPNVTGVYTAGAYAEVLDAIRACLPNPKVVGTLFVPAEVNTVFHKEQVTKEAASRGMRLEVQPAASAAEVSIAASGLCSRPMDALCQVGGNITASSFPAIASAAERAHLPIFAFLSSQARQGAAVVVTRDYHDAGRETAALAVRIMRGESPAAIPFAPVGKSKLIINRKAAQRAGLVIPDAMLKRANEVID